MTLKLKKIIQLYIATSSNYTQAKQKVGQKQQQTKKSLEEGVLRLNKKKQYVSGVVLLASIKKTKT